MRRSASVWWPVFLLASDASHFCASGVMVDGMGTTRVMWAVPSASKVAEFCCGAEADCATNIVVHAKLNATTITFVTSLLLEPSGFSVCGHATVRQSSAEIKSEEFAPSPRGWPSTKIRRRWFGGHSAREDCQLLDRQTRPHPQSGGRAFPRELPCDA